MNSGDLWGGIISHINFLFILSEILTICTIFIIKKKIDSFPFPHPPARNVGGSCQWPWWWAAAR